MRFKTPGIHEIIIRNENDTSVIPGGNSQLTIDGIDLEVADTSVTTSSDSSSTMTSIASVASSVASSGSSSPSSSVSTPPLSADSSSSPSQSSSSHSPSIGAIVGGALGGGFVLVFVLLFLFWFRLKQRRKAPTGNLGPSSVFIPPPQTSSLPPPLFSSISTTATPPTQNSIIIPSTNAQYPGRYGYAPRPRKGAQGYFPNPLPSEVSSGSTSQPPSSTQVRREQDAGPLPADLGATLPPEYSQVFSHIIHSSNIPPG